MRKSLAIFVLIIMMGAFWLIQQSPDTVSAVSSPTPLIVIDPGHGGWDPGAVRGSVFEKSLTLDVALRLGSALQRRGLRVYYTRSRDTALSSTVLRDLTQRAATANRLGATVFVSIHVNTEPSGTMSGPIVYYTRKSWSSYRLASLVTQNLASSGYHHPPRPIRQWVLDVSHMPAINVEIGFLSHSGDALRMQSPQYQSLLAEWVASGIARYLGR